MLYNSRSAPPCQLIADILSCSPSSADNNKHHAVYNWGVLPPHPSSKWTASVPCLGDNKYAWSNL